MNTQQIQRGLFGYRGLIAILRLPMLLASMTLARRLRAGLHGSRATRFPNTLLIVLTLFGASSAAGADWAANYGAVSPVGALASTSATAVDASGNIYLAGDFNGETYTLGSVTLSRIGNRDAFVAKLDAAGTVVWAKNFGGSGAIVVGISVAVDNSGNVFLGGNFYGANLTTLALTQIGNQDAFALKLDSSGNTAWAKNFGGIWAEAVGQSIAVDGSGNVVLGGYFGGTNLTMPVLVKTGNQDAFALKLDSSGNTTWAKNFGGIGAAVVGRSIAVDSSGNVYLGGYINGANLTTPALTQIGNQDAFALKLDSSGNTTWAKNFGGSGAVTYGQSIAVDGSGNVYLGGYINGSNLTTPTLMNIGIYDAFVFKLDASGNTTWAKNFGGSWADVYGQSIAVDGLGNVILGGHFHGANLITPALTKIGFQDSFALKLDSSGNTTWAKNFGGSGATAVGKSITVDGSGNVYLGGFFVGDLTTPALTKIGDYDAFVLKLDYSGTTTWAKNYGALDWSGSASVEATAVDVTGNVYIGGSFYGATFTLGRVTLTKIGNKDAFAAKLDAEGSVLWAKNFGGIWADAIGKSIAVDNSGDVVLGGYFGGDLTTPALSRIGFQSAFAIKLDSSGNTTWAKNFGGSGADVYGQSIAVDGSGNAYLGGYFSGASLTTPALNRIGNQDAFALKLDATGNTIWAVNFGGSEAYAYGQSIAVGGLGNVDLGGYFSSANLTTPALTKIGGSDAFALRLDSSGNTTWAKNFGGSGAYTTGKSIVVDSSGNVYMGGYYTGANLTTPTLTNIGYSDAFALKLDATGNTIWAKNFGGSGAFADGTSIMIDGSSNVYLGGRFFFDNLTTPALTKIGGNDAFAIKLDSSGNTTWAKNFGGSGADVYGLSISVDGSNNVVLGGNFQSANLTTPTLALIGTQDAFILKQNTTSVPGAPTSAAASTGNTQVTISFTPASDGGSAITSFTVTCNPGSITTTGVASPLVVTGLTNGISYTCSVTATNAIGRSAASANVNVTPATIPGAATNVTATASNTQAIVTFAPPASNGGSPITGYTVTSSPSGISATGTASLLTVTGLVNGTAHTFTVKATNAIGTGPASVASNSVTPADSPSAPIIGSVTVGNAQATLTFTAPASDGGSAITGYTATCTAAGQITRTNSGPASPITVGGLIGGVVYSCTVAAQNSIGSSTSSAPAMVTPLPGIDITPTLMMLLFD